MIRAQLRVRGLYLLVVVPLLTELIETGSLPRQPRAWVTEVVLGIVIVALVRRVYRDMWTMDRLARTDALTGLWNRRAFVELLDDECARARRTSESLTLVYLDLDRFKQINDEAGHEVGDRVLRHVAAAMQNAMRARVDRGFRLGGDEFALLLPEASAHQADAVLLRIRHQCQKTGKGWAADALGISCGIVQYQYEETAEQFVRRADQAMYRQKSGRARVSHLTL
jgi:diguanylate cyclase (GGDEF)-like protein